MIAEEQINALITHCERQKEKSFSRLIRDEHSDTKKGDKQWKL